MVEEEEIQKIYDIRTILRLIKYIKPYKLLLIVAALFSLLHTALQLILPYLTKIVIDDCILPHNITGLQKFVVLYLLFLIIGAIFSFGVMFLMQLIGQFVIKDLRVETFAHIQKLRIAFFDRTPVGRLVTRVTNDTEAINGFFSEVIVRVFVDAFMLIGVVAVMLKLNPMLSLVTFTVVPPLVFIINLFRIQVRKVYRKIRKWLAQINTKLNETFIGIQVVQLFNQEQENYKKFAAVNHNYFQSNMHQIVVYGIFLPLVDMLLSCAIALIIWWGGGQVIRATLSLGVLVAFIAYIRMLFQPIQEIAHEFDVMQSSFAATERIFRLLDTKEFEPSAFIPQPSAFIPQLKGEIEFKNVWFSYNNEEWVLKDISFYIRQGEKVAIVGPTGAGKTSLINLLTKFYEPQKGEILIDQTPIQDIDPSILRKNIALVSQNDFIFSGSIRDNIRLRNPEIQDTTIKEAAKFVNAHQFIEKLPLQYDQEVKERGQSLSVGELQLLSFARALAFLPRILILDEATREVDTETEKLIQDATHKLLQSRTAIVIAHRLSTIHNVDRIIVLHHGKIIEEGTHRELLGKRGFYKALYELQYK